MYLSLGHLQQKQTCVREMETKSAVDAHQTLHSILASLNPIRPHATRYLSVDLICKGSSPGQETEVNSEQSFGTSVRREINSLGVYSTRTLLSARRLQPLHCHHYIQHYVWCGKKYTVRTHLPCSSRPSRSLTTRAPPGSADHSA